MPVPTRSAPAPPAIVLRVLIGRLARRLRQTQAGGQLTPTQLSVLGAVAQRGPIGLAELSQLEGINPTMLSRIVAKLGGVGLLSRRVDAFDGRAATVRATEQGRRLYRRIQAERNDVLGQCLEELPSSLRRQLVEAIPALEALAEALLAPDR
ncbi:MAG TPA: MarR family winged helix-turn-helix transcriptional regulator [Candidatus Dormibacteraeota bacterium]